MPRKMIVANTEGYLKRFLFYPRMIKFVAKIFFVFHSNNLIAISIQHSYLIFSGILDSCRTAELPSKNKRFNS